MNNFLYRWLQATVPASERPELKEEAASLGIDISKNTYAIVVEHGKFATIEHDSVDFVLQLNPEQLVIITQIASNIEHYAHNAEHEHLAYGIGQPHVILGLSVQQAQRVLKFQHVFPHFKHYHRYDDLAFDDALLQVQSTPKELLEKIKNLIDSDTGEDLLTTIMVFIEQGGNCQATAEALHIHRNTLNYRLHSIQTLTQLDPHHIKECFKLYVALLHAYQLN